MLYCHKQLSAHSFLCPVVVCRVATIFYYFVNRYYRGSLLRTQSLSSEAPPVSSSPSILVNYIATFLYALNLCIIFIGELQLWRAMSRVSIAARALSDIIGLPTSLTIVLLIVLPVLVLFSTILLCYYWIKARRTKRDRNRVASKSSQNSISTNGEVEMRLTSVEATYRPATAGSQKLGAELPTYVSPAAFSPREGETVVLRFLIIASI